MQRNNRVRRAGPGKSLQGPGAGPGVGLRQGPLQPGAGGWSSSAPSLVVPPPRRGSAAVPASCRCVGAGAWPCSLPPPWTPAPGVAIEHRGPGGRRLGGSRGERGGPAHCGAHARINCLGRFRGPRGWGEVKRQRRSGGGEREWGTARARGEGGVDPVSSGGSGWQPSPPPQPPADTSAEAGDRGSSRHSAGR